MKSEQQQQQPTAANNSSNNNNKINNKTSNTTSSQTQPTIALHLGPNTNSLFTHVEGSDLSEVAQFCIASSSRLVCGLTPSLPWPGVAWKRQIKMRDLKPLSLFVFFFTQARERTFIFIRIVVKADVRGPENILFASVHLSARKCLRLGRWRG